MENGTFNDGICDRLSNKRGLAGVCLVALTFLAYLPSIRGDFVYDDNYNVTENAYLRSVDGLRDIWTKVGPHRGGTIQYFPLTYTTFWTEYHLWKLHSAAYHVVNVLLHGLNVILAWFILRRLRVQGAWLAAAIFSIHPVHVESVAWISELKNVLSTLLYFAALLSYLRFLGFQESGESQWPCPSVSQIGGSGSALHKSRTSYFSYFLAFFLFLCALASKTTTSTLPAAILLIVWWKTNTIGARDFLPVLPMFLAGAGAGLLTADLELQSGTHGYEWALTPVERCLLAGRAAWFYAGKLIWPAHLAVIYPRWTVSQTAGWQYLYPLGILAVICALWFARDKIGRGPLTATLFFIGTLAPAMGFANFYYMRISYVADHFQYPASLGLICLFAASAWRFFLESRRRFITPATCLLLLLGMLTWRQCLIYENGERLWTDTLQKNSSCWVAHNNLGYYLNKAGKFQEASEHFSAAIRLKNDYPEARNNFGLALAGQGKWDQAIAQYREAVTIQPGYDSARNNLVQALAKVGELNEALEQYKALGSGSIPAQTHEILGLALTSRGRIKEAIACYLAGLRVLPNSATLHNNLANALDLAGDRTAAIQHYQVALKIEPGRPEFHNNLGYVLAQQRDFDAAILHFRAALAIRRDYAEAHDNLGMALAMKSQLDEAIRHFREALRISPAYAPAQQHLETTLKMWRSKPDR